MFLDSNIFINYYLSHSSDGRACAAFMQRINSGEQKASISPLVVDEVLYVLLEERGRDFTQKALQTMLMNPNLQMLSIDRTVLSRLPEYLEQDMAPRDAMHAATMVANGVDVICSYDHGFDSIKGIKRQEPK